MKIIDYTTGTSLPENSTVASPNITASQGDVDWFSAALEPSQATPSLAGQEPDGLFSQTASVFGQLDSDKKNLDSVLRKASRETDPLVLKKVDSSLSNYYLENMMNAKIVSKGVQGLEKLTNLQ